MIVNVYPIIIARVRAGQNVELFDVVSSVENSWGTRARRVKTRNYGIPAVGWNSKDSERLLRPARRRTSASRRIVERGKLGDGGCIVRGGTTLKRERERSSQVESSSPSRLRRIVIEIDTS